MKGKGKILALLLAAVLCCSFSACNDSQSDGGDIPPAATDDGKTEEGGAPPDDETGNDGEDQKPSDTQKPSEEEPSEEPPTLREIFAADAIPERGKLFRDPDFSSGFTVTSFASNETPHYLGEIHYDRTTEEFAAAGGKGAQWILAQWGCKNRVSPNTIAKKEGNEYVYETASSRVKVDSKTGAVLLEANSAKEYDAPRKNGESWPHLLLGQSNVFTRESYNDAPYLSQMQSLTVSLDFTVKKAENLTGNAYNPSLHAAQFQWFLVVQNMNKKSAGYGDMIWFGLPLYDNRHTTLTQDGISIDGGKDDASWQLICNMGSKRYLYEPTKVGKRTTVNADVLQWIREVFDKAKTEGDGHGNYAFTNSEFSDLKITSTNIGWELPGTFDVAVEIEHFSANYTLR